jgi:peptidyl-prolyl cis-trans isomerase SurA
MSVATLVVTTPILVRISNLRFLILKSDNVMTENFKKIINFSLILMSSAFLMLNAEAASQTNATPKKNTESLDRIVAVVNDSIITQSELNEAMQNIKKQMAASNTPAPSHEVLEKRVLDQLIDRKLQMLLAEQAGVQITDEISVKELYSKVASSGVDVNSYHKEIREEMLIQEIQQHEVGAKINITPQEVNDFTRSASWKAFYNKEYHLEDILIALPEAPTPQNVAQAKKQAEAVLAQLHKGKSFSQVAIAESGNTRALQGGDLGWLKLPQIPPTFSSELVHMKVNDIMGPVATPNGFHIIRLAGLRETTASVSAEAQRKQVEQLLYQRKLEEGLQSWVTKLRSEAFINTHPES